jgi:hypothetical protein
MRKGVGPVSKISVFTLKIQAFIESQSDKYFKIERYSTSEINLFAVDE